MRSPRRELARARLVHAAIALCAAACGHGASDGLAPSASHEPTATASAGRSSDVDAGVMTHLPQPEESDATAPPTACNATLAAGDSTLSLTSGGRARTAFVHVPKGLSSTSRAPLVFDFHPLSVDASTWKLATGWADLADKEGFILVVPQGIGNSWNAGRCCGDAHDGGVDDVQLVRDLITRLSTDACIDRKRVFAPGCSNGGGMSYRLACDAADVIAAVAPVDFDCVTGPTNSPSCASCSPSRPISVVQFRGTADNLVPYGGGPTQVVAGFEFPGAKASFADWGARNACGGAPETVASRPLCQRYPTCAAGAETELCTLPLGVHCGSYLPFGLAKVAWDVMSAHPLP